MSLAFCPPAPGHALDADAAVRMVPVEPPADRYWSRWRGPSGQGLVDTAGHRYADSWSPTENVAWRVEIPGRGHSSPIVWGDKIFLTTSYDGGARRSLLALDRADGSLEWETLVPPASPESMYPKNSHASSTPSTDGKLVYAYFGNHGLVAVDFDGRLVWQQSFGDVPTRHGSAGSPLLYQDRIVLYQDHTGPEGSFIAAYERATGQRLWRTPRRETVGWGTPVAIRLEDGRDEIVVSGERRVYAYDPATGKELWSCAGNLSEAVPTPVVGEGLLFCSTGRAGPTLAIRPGGKGDVTGDRVVWQTSKGSPFIPSPIVYDGRLYMVNDMVSVASCHRAADGELLWQGRLGEARREGFSASPVAFDGKVFFTNDEGDTFVLRAGDAFELLRVNSLGEQTLASPALVDGKWYFRTERHLVCIGA
ncbi:MAG TPA: PQQ-binding-like beta-propeller repeat protein [Thermoanaerobaculia bacterium]|nr:PQQ-binding-like beta-propeller repeat protein [Thermoanaerobaculia bacterium]